MTGENGLQMYWQHLRAACCRQNKTDALNVITPVVLTVLGLILPAIAKREQAAAKQK